ncbi:MAG: cytochrome-c peroxidase [Cytophagales bacterium]|nr:MAG: cytochrome-c peroxidase [Cytophagales bacterium]
MKKTICIFLIAFTFLSCTEKKEKEKLPDPEIPYSINVPVGFPTMDIPSDNPVTKEKIELGKMLFFDPILSLDSTISCSSCHLQAKSFADPRKLSVGVNDCTGVRNAPPLFNLAYQSFFFRDGGVFSMEQQVLSPIENPIEMNLDPNIAVKRLNRNQKYINLFQKAFKRNPDLFSLTRAIASFERTLLSGNSKYDQYAFQNNKEILSSSELKGMNIFFNEGQCSNCHSGFNFTNNLFENNGIYEKYFDMGRFRITTHFKDVGKFKVPSLRNIELTAPYMHDGSMNTLEEVIEHYNNGGKNHVNQSKNVMQLNLSETQKSDLIAFLKTLTDKEFINNSAFKKH